MMSVYGDDSDELEDEETAEYPAQEQLPVDADGVVHYRLGGPFGQSEDPS